MNKIKSLYFNLPLDKPYLTIILCSISTVLLAIGVSWIRIDDDFVKMFPDNIPSKIIWDKIQDEFGSTEYLVVAFGNKDKSILDNENAYNKLIDVVQKYENLNNLVNQVIAINNNFADKGEKTLKNNYTEDQINHFTNDANNYLSFYIVPKVGVNNTQLVTEIKKIAETELKGYDVHFAGQPCDYHKIIAICKYI